MRHFRHRRRHNDFAAVERALRPRNRREATTMSPKREELEELYHKMKVLRTQRKQLVTMRIEADNFYLTSGASHDVIELAETAENGIEILDSRLDDVSRRARQVARELQSDEGVLRLLVPVPEPANPKQVLA